MERAFVIYWSELGIGGVLKLDVASACKTLAFASLLQLRLRAIAGCSCNNCWTNAFICSLECSAESTVQCCDMWNAVALLAVSAVSTAFAPRRVPPSVVRPRATPFDDVLTSTELPIVDVMSDIRAPLSSDGAYVFLEAPPGAGKTTTVPLAAAATVSEGLVVVVEPRRVAARAAARRMAQSLGDDVGGLV